MEKVLGRKQNISNEEWVKAYSRIEELVSMEELKELVETTVEQIRATVGEKRAAYAWSGGKDSLVLGKLCEMAGVEDCMLGVCDLEYPAFLSWVKENKPEKLEIINTGQGLEWLSRHQHMLFPQESKTAAQWFHIVQHRAQAKYYKQHELEILLLGRRKADGNYVGRGSNIYTDGKGVTRFSPLSDWPHEAVLAFIHYYDVPMPPIYDWKNGFYCGTHAWAARQWTGSVPGGWKEVYDIDPSLVVGAAGHIDSAKIFLESMES